MPTHRSSIVTIATPFSTSMISVKHVISVAGRGLPMLVVLAVSGVNACSTSPRDFDHLPPESSCTVDGDCPLGQICSLGDCVEGCRAGDDRCPPGTGCIGGACSPLPDGGNGGVLPDGASVNCSEDMVPVGNSFCMDRYEASRPDATDVTFGDDESKATSRPNVLPWFPVVRATALLACAYAGKRLCTPTEFEEACRGPAGTVYSYGDSYDPATCNGIDTYCYCGTGSPCQELATCPYPHCYGQPPAGQTAPPTGCGASAHAKPTGSFEDCRSGYGVVDINGNVWELADDGTAEGQYRGGAFNCVDSVTLHRCDHVAGNITAKGFRCCR